MARRQRAIIGVLTLITGGATQVIAQTASLPMQPGESVVTCSSGIVGGPGSPLDQSGFVVALINTVDPAGQGADVAGQTGTVRWPAPMYHNESAISPTGLPIDEWRASSIGQVFGVVLDDANPPNIYVTASTIYGDFGSSTFAPPNSIVGPGGGIGGEIYRIDGTTGAICLHALVPNGGVGLGNIAFDPISDTLYVSNFEDGVIYSFPAGPCTGQTFFCNAGDPNCHDHGLQGRPQEGLARLANDPMLSFTQFGRRVWGVAVHEGERRLYYSVWWEDGRLMPPGGPNPVEANEIWSVAIDSTGAFVPDSARLDVTMEPLVPGGSFSHPVSDIHFAPSGNMVLSERTRLADTGQRLVTGQTDAHAARVIELTGSSGLWISQPLGKWRIGGSGVNGPSSAGGAAMTCDGQLLGTGDALHFPFPYLYGLQIVPAGGNEFTGPPQTADSYLIDLDGNIGVGNKTEIGDVAVYSPACQCMEVEVKSVLCELSEDPPGVTGNVNVTLCITNRSGVTAHYMIFPFAEAVDHIVPFQTPLANNATATVTVSFTLGHVSVLAPIVLADEKLEECCVGELTFTAPECDCLQVTSSSLVFDQSGPAGTLSFTFDNLTPDTIEHLLILPEPFDPFVNITPDWFALGPVPGYSSYSGTINATVDLGYSPVPGSTVCFRISIHTGAFRECCSQVVCFTVASSSDCCGCPGEPGCDNTKCESLVCAVDPFCCQVQWDLLCCEQANVECAVLCDGDVPTPVLGDCNGDGVVDGADLGMLLGAFGSKDPVADLNGDGVVDGGDLGILLSAWAP